MFALSLTARRRLADKPTFNVLFDKNLFHIDLSELQLNKANVSDAEASFLDLHLSISDGFAKTKIYNKRDDFDFDIVTFLF